MAAGFYISGMVRPEDLSMIRISEFERAIEFWDGFRMDDELDGPVLAGCALDEAALVQADASGRDPRKPGLLQHR
jgi:hypothetical protein